MILAGLFAEPMTLGGWTKTLMILPLCLSIALVYKSIKCETPREVLTAGLTLWVTIVVGMYVVGVALWGLYLLMI